MIRKILRSAALAFTAIFVCAIIANAQTSPSTEFQNIKIKNFGQMDENYFRGAQPLQEDYQSLKDLGITTVIDLRNDPTNYEKPSVEALGMKYINIPMSGWKYPKDAYVSQFLNIMNSPETGKVFVHCKAGIHRTGMTGAVYRFEKYGWDYDQAYKEMKNYEFSSGLFHGALKTYVKDYAKRIKRRAPETAAASASLANAN